MLTESDDSRRICQMVLSHAPAELQRNSDAPVASEHLQVTKFLAALCHGHMQKLRVIQVSYSSMLLKQMSN